MTTTMTRDVDLLGCSFEPDEIKDIAQHGCAGGVPGFIYSSELYDVFSRFEDTIMDYLEEFADSCMGITAEAMIVNALHDDEWTLQQFRGQAVRL